jgi:hypothetical protein
MKPSEALTIKKHEAQLRVYEEALTIKKHEAQLRVYE